MTARAIAVRFDRGSFAATGRRLLAATRSEPYYVGTSAAFVLLLGVAMSGAQVSRDVDSPAYFKTSTFSLASVNFWGGGRAWLTPLFIKVFGYGGGPVVAWTIVSAVCWLCLAAATARAVSSEFVKRLGFTVVLLLALSYNVLQWDQWIASDSLSISLGVLLVGLALEVVRAPRPWSIGAIAVVALLWGSDRDSNGLLAFILLGAIGVVLIALRFRRQGAILIAAGLCVAAFSTWSSNAIHRWDYAMLDVLSHRILTSSSATSFFERRGMPVEPGMHSWPGEQAGTFWVQFNTAADLAPFRTWFFANMQTTYTEYLVAHPELTIRGSLGDLGAMISPNVQEYQAPSLRLVLPPLIEGVVYPRDKPTLEFLAVVLLVFGAAAAALRPSRIWWIPAIVGLSTIPHAIGVWSGEPLNIDKHSVTLAVFFRVALVLAAVFVADTALARRRELTREQGV
jgi:hypothetical protein